jgi:hypothetical protein
MIGIPNDTSATYYIVPACRARMPLSGGAQLLITASSAPTGPLAAGVPRLASLQVQHDCCPLLWTVPGIKLHGTKPTKRHLR